MHAWSVSKHAVVGGAFLFYAQHGEGRLEVVHKIVMAITLLIMENHGTFFLNFCGNTVAR